MKSLHKALLAAALLCLPVPAQGPIVTSDHVVGWVNHSPLAPGQVHMQDVDNCQPATVRCKTSLYSTANQYAGGTAYDINRQAVWVSNGSTFYLQSLRNCKYLCQVNAAKRDPQAVVSGLAISDRRQRLYHLETRPGYLGIVVYDNSKCPPKVVGGCSYGPQAKTTTAAGLAYDEARDLLYIATSYASGNSFMVVRASNPCQVICHPPVPSCGKIYRRLTGLAYNACTRVLYATDGQYTRKIVVSSVFPQCNIKMSTCCAKLLAGDFRGLSLIPGWQKTAVGEPCRQGTCPCTSMVAGASGGDPGLGARNFNLNLANAPPGSRAWLALAVGPCSVGLPFLCGILYPNLANPNIIVGPLTVAGAGTCGGSLSVPLIIPVNTSFCGQKFCAQWAVGCLTAVGSGFALSNAIEFNTTGG